MTLIVAYDAYGNNLGFDAANALTTLLYSGEQFDQRIAMQYLRARYFDAATGRFNRLDPFFGNLKDPQSLHKYLYVHGDPISGVDPSGNEFTLVGLGKSMAIGAIVGGTIGGIDAWLGGENVLYGIVSGAAFGALLGGLAFAFPAVFASSYMFGFGMGFSIPFIAQSFSEGKNAQGFFRVITGIGVPLALRNAAIARLLIGSRAAVSQRLAALWQAIKLRSNSYGLEPGISGSYVNSRVPLSSNVAPGRYLYVVDEAGQMWLAPIEAEVAGIGVKHSSLVAHGERVRAAGHLVIKPDKVVNLNSDSGHFMRYAPILSSEEAAWFTAVVETILSGGLVPGDISPLSGAVPG